MPRRSLLNRKRYAELRCAAWVFENYERADEVYHEHLSIIDRLRDDVETRDRRIRALERENAELKAKLIKVHQRQFKSNKKKTDKTESALRIPLIPPPESEGIRHGIPIESAMLIRLIPPPPVGA